MAGPGVKSAQPGSLLPPIDEPPNYTVLGGGLVILIMAEIRLRHIPALQSQPQSGILFRRKGLVQPARQGSPTMPTVTIGTLKPNIPTVPTISIVPTVHTLHNVPTMPTVPTVPTVPTAPTMPTMPTVPTVPTVPPHRGLFYEV